MWQGEAQKQIDEDIANRQAVKEGVCLDCGEPLKAGNCWRCDWERDGD